MNKTHLLYALFIVILLAINSVLVYFLINNKTGRYSFQYVVNNNHVLIGDTGSGRSWLCLPRQVFEEQELEKASYESSKEIKLEDKQPLSDEEFERQIKAIKEGSYSQEEIKFDYSKGCMEIINPQDFNVIK